MDMNWFECILYGLVSGMTEILPVSSQAHEALLLKLFGAGENPLLRILVHTAIWEALYLSLRDHVELMLQERDLARIPPRRRDRQPDPIPLFDLKLTRSALIPMLLGFALSPLLRSWQTDLSKAAIFLVLNGLILYIPCRIQSGNKDSRSMTGLDSLLLGISGALAVFPGISRVGAVVSTAVGRGADKEHALRWAFLLSLAALMGVIGFDALALFRTGVEALTVPVVLSYALATAAAFFGAVAGIRGMRFLAVHTGFSGFSYYCWGAALFAFLMYLTI